MGKGKKMFSGIRDAKMSTDSNYARRGHYLAMITKMKADETRAGDDFVAVEMTILHTFEDGDGKDLQGSDDARPEDTWHRPGEDMSHLMMAKHDSFLGNLKACIANVLDVEPAEVTEEACIEATDPDGAQPMAGRVVELKNRVITTRAGKPFTKVSYAREVDPSEYAEVIDQKVLARYVPDLDERLAEEGADD